MIDRPNSEQVKSLLKNADYVFVGGGLAARSMLARMSEHTFFSNKQIVVIEPGQKLSNDRTWCFWESDPGFFQPIVYHEWKHCDVYVQNKHIPLEMGTYKYKCIRSIDFYQYTTKLIEKNLQVSYITESVVEIESSIQGCAIQLSVSGKCVTNAVIFNSIYKPQDIKANPTMWQHFLGYEISMDTAAFEPSTCRFMDFRVPQEDGLSFMYVLPFTQANALVELTYFTDKLISVSHYRERMNNYIKNYISENGFEIKHQEFGCIPMTTHRFTSTNPNIIAIGTAGGWTKPSTGYTFQFSQKFASILVQQLLAGEAISTPRHRDKFHWYDTILLRVLQKEKQNGFHVFRQLFEHRKAYEVFKFLDEETSAWQEFNIIRSFKPLPFTRAMLKR